MCSTNAQVQVAPNMGEGQTSTSGLTVTIAVEARRVHCPIPSPPCRTVHTASGLTTLWKNWMWMMTMTMTTTHLTPMGSRLTQHLKLSDESLNILVCILNFAGSLHTQPKMCLVSFVIASHSNRWPMSTYTPQRPAQNPHHTVDSPLQ